MKNTILIVFVLIAVNSYSQPVVNSPYEQYFGDGKVVIKGKVENKPEEMNSWNMAVCDYISNEGVTIPCQAYNIMGIPHYTLIDKEGKIVDNKCDRPSIVLMKGEGSVFDKAVKGK